MDKGTADSLGATGAGGRPWLGDAEVCRLPQLLRRLVMVDGPPRSGKSTICRIISSLKNTELERIEEIYDYIGYLFSLGKLRRDAAVAMLRAFADIHIYELYLSRNVNFRLGDKTGIFASLSPLRYLRRLFASEGNKAVEAIIADNPIMQQHAHYQMEHIGIHFDAFPDSLKVIEVLRHPIDLVSAYRDRMVGNVCESHRRVHLCRRHRDTAVHLLAGGWEDQFLAMKSADRVIRMFHGYQMRSFAAYRALPGERREKVLVQVFEDVVADPRRAAERIAVFLGTATTRKTTKAVPWVGDAGRKLNAQRPSAYARLKQECGTDSISLLDEMIANYETRWQL